jgi:uncharacterized protein (TIGR00251 family)
MKKENQSPVEKIINLWVQPRASRNEILGYRDGFLRLRVTAAPVEGKANLLCRKILAESLGVSVSQVEILNGQKSRRKRVRIEVNLAQWQGWEYGREGGR